MISIKTKIPPPLVALTFSLLVAYSKSIFPKVDIEYGSVFGSFMISIGSIIILSAIIEFKNYKTSLTPLNPSNATKLIVHGVYKFSRNPMYLGLLLILSGISIIQNPIGGLLFVPSFILYITHFQIIPEESAMLDLFKDDFSKYKENVRRWI